MMEKLSIFAGLSKTAFDSEVILGSILPLTKPVNCPKPRRFLFGDKDFYAFYIREKRVSRIWTNDFPVKGIGQRKLSNDHFRQKAGTAEFGRIGF